MPSSASRPTSATAALRAVRALRSLPSLPAEACLSGPSSREFDRRVGVALVRLRRASGLSQNELATRVGAQVGGGKRRSTFPQSKLSRLEGGLGHLSLRDACRLARALGVSLRRLVG